MWASRRWAFQPSRMGAYIPLFSLEVAHSYFPDGACRGLRLAPSAASAELIERSGCLWRATDRGLVLLFDVAASSGLRMRAEDKDEPLRFHFVARAGDPVFANYTEGNFGSQHAVLMFDSRNAALEESTGRWVLPGQAVPLAEAEALSASERHVPPSFGVTLENEPVFVGVSL